MAKQCARGLALRGMLVETETVSIILNRSLLRVSPRMIAKEVRIPVTFVEEVLDFVEHQDLRESWTTRLVDAALSAFWPDCERGRTTPRMRFVAYRGPDGRADLDQYRHHRDRLEMLAGRELPTEADRQAARDELHALAGLASSTA